MVVKKISWSKLMGIISFQMLSDEKSEISILQNMEHQKTPSPFKPAYFDFKMLSLVNLFLGSIDLPTEPNNMLIENTK